MKIKISTSCCDPLGSDVMCYPLHPCIICTLGKFFKYLIIHIFFKQLYYGYFYTLLHYIYYILYVYFRICIILSMFLHI